MQPLMTLAEHNMVQMIWVPRYKQIAGTKSANFLASECVQTPFIGSETACNNSGGAIRGASRD